MTGVAAILGAGTIGGGWAARFALMGWQVRVFDPAPEAIARLQQVLDNARRAMPGLYDTPLPPEGEVVVVETISKAVTGADWIQESVSERLDLKRTLYQKVQEHCGRDAILASSTAGFTPSALRGQGGNGGPVLVAHPVNPVYLLPLVELVATRDTPATLIRRAREVLTGIGMVPLPVRHEIDGHIATRLLETVRREALWLVKDDIATTGEIDDAIRLGIGLSWAQMGVFESGRIDGGEPGKADFQSRVGSSLGAPWSHLTDVPDLTEDLGRKIADQSEAQSGARSVAELERQRDTNLVGVLRALKWTGAGAGAHLNAHDAGAEAEVIDVTRPIVTQDRAVPLDWTDYNGHMTESRYLYAFADATDRFMEIIGCDADYIATGGSYFTAETHIRHLAEVHAGAKFRVETICLNGAGKKMHLFHQMYSGDTLLATGEHLLLHVSLETRRSAPPAPKIAQRLGEIATAHANLPRPDGVGRAVGQKPGT